MSALFLLLLPVISLVTPPLTRIGNDISYPSCRGSYPVMPGFVIVGVNGGIASRMNPCLADELLWARYSLGTSQRSKVQLYVNTGNPSGDTSFWPLTNSDPQGNIAPNPYGVCDGLNSAACAWQYGWNCAIDDIVNNFISAVTIARGDKLPSHYLWWLDVETKNSWESGSPDAYRENRAALEGMVAAFHAKNISVGVYATNYQWTKIVGSVPQNSNLNGLPNWLPGASDLQEAQTYCFLPPLTPGAIVLLTQYTSDTDYDYSCV